MGKMKIDTYPSNWIVTISGKEGRMTISTGCDEINKEIFTCIDEVVEWIADGIEEYFLVELSKEEKEKLRIECQICFSGRF